MNWLWPKLVNREIAHKASLQGTIAAALIAIGTSVIIALNYLDVGLPEVMSFPKEDLPYLLAYTAFLALLGWGISRHSRIAAISALILYVVDAAAEIIYFQDVRIISVILTLAFINGARGTVAYHRFRNTGGPTIIPDL